MDGDTNTVESEPNQTESFLSCQSNGDATVNNEIPPPVQETITSSSRNASSESNTKSESTTSNQPQQNNTSSNDKNPQQSSSSSRTTSTETTSSSTTTTTSAAPAPTWGGMWSGFSALAKEVGSAVVEGVKEELQEIKEDIDTVAGAAVHGSKTVYEVSQTVGGKVLEQTSAAAVASKDFLENDLNEFGKVLGEETRETMKDAKNVGETVGATLGGWLGSLSNAVASSSLITGNQNYYDDENVSGIIIGKNKQKVNFVTAYEARIHNLRTDTSTYCVEPIDTADYELWRETFELDAQSTKQTISDILVNSQEVRSLYTKLVPSAVAHQEFWQRYFYKLDALERAERKRSALMERADRSGTEEEEDLSWGDDDETEEQTSPTPKKDEELKVPAAPALSTNPPASSTSSDSPVMIPGAAKVSSSTTPVSKLSEKSAAQQQLESDDWEKEFEIDMTEEEIAKALKNGGEDAADENLDDWD